MCRLLKFLFCLISLGNGLLSVSQTRDSSMIAELKEVTVVSYRGMNGIGHFNEIQRSAIFAGKKTEVILVDSIDANKAINNTRQILGRIPGLNIVESETGGFVANGIGIRGLNPVQSLEMNVRQNGYNIAADVYGYNETYYLPPMESVERIEVVKGAASLQFGSHLGGMVNYVIKEGDHNKPFTFQSMETVGSYGLFNSYTAVGGTMKKWNYMAFFNFRTLDGWRTNSRQQQLIGYGKINYQINNKISLGIDYSLLRNKIKMPGGLTDDQYEANSRASYRTRNWLESPWNIITARMDYTISKNTFLNIQSTYIYGQRNLVWFSKLPDVKDSIDGATGQYTNREVDREIMKSSATEIRLLHHYEIGKIKNILAAGVRFSIARFERLEEGPGTNGTGMDLSVKGEFDEQYRFKTVNIAPFFENLIRVNDKFSITPGIRFESLESEVEAEYETGGIEKETEEEKSRSFILFGVGLQHKIGKSSNIYANTSESYHPIDYAQLVPLGSVSKVDPNLQDPRGWNNDIGIRGTIRNFFNYDAGLFFLRYNKRIGLVIRTDNSGNQYILRTNIAQSEHKGIESYLELNITRWLEINKKTGDLSIYNSFAFMHARYTKGEYKGKKVEYAPDIVNRIGLTYSKKLFSTSIQYSYQSKSYGDASNVEKSTNPIIGYIPSYGDIDWSVTLKIKQLKVKAGANNLANKKYFTQRTDEYPGPGIIPSVGRSFYAGIGLDIL